ncbi:hypothetical protein [Enterococcus hirae]|uniref:hypothetical protein n=1 Tax=Enterococcus hirae TaxID=1354 RepID=UPI001F316991|nr:hypothetical protein [Enterococcus hirae]
METTTTDEINNDNLKQQLLMDKKLHWKRLDSSMSRSSRAAVKTIPMYRLFNPNSGEHSYTLNAKERDSTLYKTKQKVYFKAPPTVCKKIGVGDIVIFSVKGKKHHVLIMQVYKSTELNKEVSFIQPNFKPFF